MIISVNSKLIGANPV